MPCGGGQVAVAGRLRLPALRRPAAQRNQDPRALSVHRLPAADVADCRDDLHGDQACAAELVRALYHLTQSKQGISSLELGRRLGVTQTTAWTVKHKLKQVMMERDAKKRLIGRLEMDDAYLGGHRSGGKPVCCVPCAVFSPLAGLDSRRDTPAAQPEEYETSCPGDLRQLAHQVADAHEAFGRHFPGAAIDQALIGAQLTGDGLLADEAH